MKGQIYKITSPHTDKVYIGSTSRRLEIRFSCHKSAYKCINDKQITVNEILCYDDCKIELIEEVEYDDIKDLKAKESQYIREMKELAVNKRIDDRTKKDWIKQHKNHISVVSKAYYEANKEKLNARRKERYNANKELMNARQRELYALKKANLSHSSPSPVSSDS